MLRIHDCKLIVKELLMYQSTYIENFECLKPVSDFGWHAINGLGHLKFEFLLFWVFERCLWRVRLRSALTSVIFAESYLVIK